MFGSLKKSVIIMLGGYPDVDSVIESIKETDDSEERGKILTQAVKKLFNTISKEDILQLTETGAWKFQGKPLMKEEVEALKREADIFKKMRLYKVLDTECRYQANKKMFVESSSLVHLESGKIMLYLWDVIRTRLAQM